MATDRRPMNRPPLPPGGRPPGPRRLAPPPAAPPAVPAGPPSAAVVVRALGETAGDLDRFRAAVAESLGAAGAAEREFADRAALLMWRQRRVTRAEAAMVVPARGPRPPGRGRVPACARPDAPLPKRLAAVRLQLESAAATLAEHHRALSALDPAAPRGRPLGDAVFAEVVQAAAAALGQAWDEEADSYFWEEAIEAADFETTFDKVPRTPAALDQLLRAAAGQAGRPPADVVAAVRARVAGAVADAEQAIERLRGDEAELDAALAAAGSTSAERAAARRVCMDEERTGPVARAEVHLSRELDRALAALAALQAAR